METTTAIRLPAIFAKYHEDFPDVELSLMTGPTDELLNAILNYGIEAALVAGPVDHPQLQQVATIQEELVLVSSPNGKNDSPIGGSVTVLAFREGCLYRKRLEQYLDHVGIQSRKVIELGSLDGILGCASAGLGISFIPRSVINEGRYELAVHNIPDEFGHVPTVLVRRKSGFISSALAKFIETVQQSSQSNLLTEHVVS